MVTLYIFARNTLVMNTLLFSSIFLEFLFKGETRKMLFLVLFFLCFCKMSINEYVTCDEDIPMSTSPHRSPRDLLRKKLFFILEICLGKLGDEDLQEIIRRKNKR